MALVPCDPLGAAAVSHSNSIALGPAGDYEFSGYSDLGKLTKKIENLKQGKRDKKYIGLGNQGATCYMNSAIQTLYMTPEFRKAILAWRYNPDVHGSKEYSIPYQL